MAKQHRRALPLRVGLVAAMLLLVAVGLLASGIAVTSILRHGLINRARPDAARRVARLGAGPAAAITAAT